jgi:outer membrane protein assembly factor BamB
MANLLIDLGEVSGQPADVPAPARRDWFRAVRGTVTALTVGLLATLAAGSRLPQPDRPTVVPAQFGDATMRGRDTLFVVSGTGDARDRIVTAYRLPDATPVSRTPVTLPGAITSLHLAGDILLVTHQTDTSAGDTTVALVAGTGRQLWRHVARVITFTEGDRLALLLDQAGGPVGQRWFAVNVGNGAVAWSHGLPPYAATDLVYADGDVPSRVVTATPGGHVEVRDAESGVLTAVADLPVQRRWRDHGIYLWAVDDLLLLGGTTGIDAYNLADLALRWSNTIDLTQYFVAPGCGDMLCLAGRFGGLQVLDPRTGRARWSAERWAIVQRAGRYMLVNQSAGPGRDRPLIVVDADTGRQTGTFGAWQPVGEALPDGRVIAVRERPGDRDVRYAVLDPATASVRVLGVADGVTADCQPAANRLVCRRLDASIGVWPLEP